MTTEMVSNALRFVPTVFSIGIFIVFMWERQQVKRLIMLIRSQVKVIEEITEDRNRLARENIRLGNELQKYWKRVNDQTDEIIALGQTITRQKSSIADMEKVITDNGWELGISN